MKFYRKVTEIVGMLALVMLMVCCLANAALALDILGITTESINTNAIKNQEYSQTIIAAGGTQPYTFSWEASVNSSLPPGLDINFSTGEISGTPTATGSYTFKVTVADSSVPQLKNNREYTLTVHDPIPQFVPCPQKFCINDPVSLDLGLPNGVSPSATPYAIVLQVNTGTYPIDTNLGVAELTATGTAGIYHADWAKCLSNPGDYMVLVFDGEPAQGKWPIACGYFAVVVPDVQVESEVWSDYSNYFRFDLSEDNEDNVDVWSGSDAVCLRIYKLEKSGANTTRTLAGKVNNNINIWDDGMSFLLPSGLTAGDYEIDIINNATVIATAGFTINLQYLPISPGMIYTGYGDSAQIVLNKPDGNGGIWYAREADLGIKIINKNNVVIKSFNLPGNAVGGSSINFVLPPALDPGSYKIQLLKAAKVIACSELYIEIHRVNMDPPALQVNDTSFTLSEADTDLWAVGDTLSLELYSVDSNDNYTLLTGYLSEDTAKRTDTAITVNILKTLSQGEYVITVLRTQGTVTEYIGITEFGAFISSPAVSIDLDGESFLVDGYSGPVSGTLTDTAENLWAAHESLVLVLKKQKSGTVFAPNNLETAINYLIPAVAEDTVCFTLPEGLSSGRYLLALIRMNGTTPVPIAHAIFLVKPNPIQLQVNPEETNREYKSDMVMQLYLYNETPSWSVNDSLGVKLFKLDVNGETDISASYPAEILYLNGYCIYVSIPEGLPIGQYRYGIENDLGRIAYGDFIVNRIYLDTITDEFEEGNAAALTIKLSLDGEPWTAEGTLTYTVQKRIWDDNNNDSYIDTGLSGNVGSAAASGYLTVSLPAGMDDGEYIFVISKDGQEYAQAQIYIAPTVPRLMAGKVLIATNTESAIVPIEGSRLNNVAGISFRLWYDQNVAIIGQKVNGDMDITTDIPNATIITNVNNVEGYADITITCPGTVGDYSGPVCEIGFDALGNEYNNTNLDFQCIPSDRGDLPLLIDADTNPLNEWNTSGGYIQIRPCGDINLNNQIDVGDAVKILRYCADPTSVDSSILNIADTYLDHVIDARDAICVLKKVVKLVDSLPVKPAAPVN